MRLKRLEMQGFKSFVERTIIEFGDGLTGVVGPNGCGKSNVSDAIRWVLGEQAPRNLRAKKMEDVIFNGSAERKQLGMAEVSMTLIDLKGTVTSAAFKDFNEVVVTRRLYRSGESEYLINRNPCRLKDIVDLFLDTGVSLDTFSIVEQGRIEGLVNAKPMDRRVLIEEAAGIMKYKSRRNEALRKLELAQANLLRVADIMREKEGRLRSLRRQARKATFFKEYRAEIKELELRIAALDFLRLDDQLGPAEQAYDRLKESEQALLTNISSREAERENVRIGVAERSEALAETRRRAVEVEGYVQRLENRLEMLSSRLVELDAEDARRAEEVETLDREARELEAERARLAEAEASLSAQATEAQQLFDVRSAELSAVRAELSEVEAASVEARRSLSREAEAFSRARQDMATAASRREGVGEAVGRLERELAEIRAQLEQARTAVGDQDARLSEIARGEERLREEAAAAAGERGRIEERLRAQEAELAAAREALVRARSSLQAIENLAETAVEGRAGADAFRARGAEVIGAFSDALIVEDGYDRAIEVALGERLLGVVVKGAEDAASAVRALGAEQGRAIALPAAPRGIPAPAVPAMEGVLGAASRFVRCADAYRPLVEQLLGGVGVARDMEAALEAWKKGPSNVTWVTLQGEILYPSGVVEGGAPVAAVSGVLERTRRCEELRVETRSGEERLAELERVCERWRQELEAAGERAAGAEARRREAELLRVEAEAGARSLREKADAAAQRVAALEAERARMLDERGRLEVAHGQAETESRRASAAREEAEARLEAAEQELRRVSARSAEIEARVADQRVALTETVAKAAGARSELQRVEEGISQNAARRERRREEQQDSRDKRERLQQNLHQSREELGRYREEKVAIEAEQAGRVKTLQEAQSQDEELGAALRRLRAEAGEVQGRLSEAAERRTTLRVQRESMIADAQEEHGVALPEAAPAHRDQLPDYHEHVTRLDMLRQRLGRMGEVNPLAAQEFDEINQEYAFLLEQQQDLEKSITDLHATIDKLNKTTRQRFLEAFEDVQKSFADIFGRLFQGGEARMFLLDPNDPLETGVDIEVRPPGKRPSNIMLLSAGEKALTAISLLFAVFSVRPSPFCLLDEVDATLDDANVGRFREVIAELEGRSQFIIITHNKRTMSYASQLYGVTQREKGVSEVVSVKLNRREEANGNGTAAETAAEAVREGS